MKKTKLKEVVKCRDCCDTHVCQFCSGYGFFDEGEDGTFDCKDCGGSGVCPWCPEDDDASGC